jgi:Holliday junction resolvasome RuvABC endonuclease subunit
MDELRILALDNALGITGWAADGQVGTFALPKPHNRTELALAERLAAYESWLMRKLSSVRPHLAVIEGYSFASPNRSHQLGELGWACRRSLLIADVPWVVVTPGQRAKYATGKGNAPKVAVLLAAARTLGYTGTDDNAADALWLWTMATDYYTGEVKVRREGEYETVVLSMGQRDVLGKVEWPAADRLRR